MKTAETTKYRLMGFLLRDVKSRIGPPNAPRRGPSQGAAHRGFGEGTRGPAGFLCPPRRVEPRSDPVRSGRSAEPASQFSHSTPYSSTTGVLAHWLRIA